MNITSDGEQQRSDVSPYPTSSHRVGHPSIMIPGTTRTAVTDALVNRLASNGWTVTKSNDYLLEVEQPAKGAAGILGSVLSINRYLTDPVYRVTFNIFESGGGVRATAAEALIQNPHTGAESPVRLERKKQEAGLWDLLESVRDQLGRVPVSSDSTRGVTR